MRSIDASNAGPSIAERFASDSAARSRSPRLPAHCARARSRRQIPDRVRDQQPRDVPSTSAPCNPPAAPSSIAPLRVPSGTPHPSPGSSAASSSRSTSSSATTVDLTQLTSRLDGTVGRTGLGSVDSREWSGWRRRHRDRRRRCRPQPAHRRSWRPRCGHTSPSRGQRRRGRRSPRRHPREWGSTAPAGPPDLRWGCLSRKTRGASPMSRRRAPGRRRHSRCSRGSRSGLRVHGIKWEPDRPVLG